MARAEEAKRGQAGPPPAVDERLIAPETRYELVDGELVYVSPAGEKHGSLHSKVSALLEAYAAEAYDVASDMLTRTSETSDMAPDASVFPTARDPETGGRQLEELAFEVIATDHLSRAGRKAASLSGRGVRRVFGIGFDKRKAFEWDDSRGAWRELPDDYEIVDETLVLPLPVAPLVGAVAADDAMATALLAKKTPALATAVAEGEAKGRAEGEAKGRADGLAEGEARARAEAILTVLAERGLAVSAAHAERVRACRDGARLAAWLVRAVTAPDADTVFGAD